MDDFSRGADDGAEARADRFRRLYDRTYEAVLGYTLRRAGPEDARDVVAETFLVAWRRLDEIPVDGARPWLYGVTRRVLANQRRGEERRARLAERAGGELRVAAQGPRPSDPGHADELARVAAAMARLRPADREILRLVAWEGLGTREIAIALDCSPVAARVRLHRARARLAVLLGPDDDPAPSFLDLAPPTVPAVKEW